MQLSSQASLIEQRREQLFPVLSSRQIEIAHRFAGEPRRFEPGAVVFDVGQLNTPAYLILSGSIDVARRDPFGAMSAITTQGAGEITGEISQLAGGPCLAEGRAGTQGAEAVPFESAQLRALIIGSVELGELVMRAFILRRVFLIETGAGLVLLGGSDSPETLRLENFLRRNAVPYTLLDPKVDEAAVQLIEKLEIHSPDLPLVVCPNGTVLRRPGEKAVAQCLGLLPRSLADRAYDVAVVGMGPAGLATAVYAASEGLSVLGLDARAFGGQAGASARIENYLGFPTGISGEALAGRAYAQAEKFGAIMAIPAEVKLLRSAGDGTQAHALAFELLLDEGAPIRASAVVIASGARYRKLDLPNLSTFEGRGVYYWASDIEARLCARREVVVVGGGNSAGQGTVFLAGQVARVHLLCRSERLGDNMSQYLVERIHALPNVEVHTQTELVELIGDHLEGLQAVRWRENPSGKEETRGIRHVFLFIGAVPNTDWLGRCAVSVDEKGFVRTGSPIVHRSGPGDNLDGGPLSLQTSRAGVFAIGDVRAGSVKRVSAAVGEGAAAVAQVHTYLAALHPEHRA